MKSVVTKMVPQHMRLISKGDVKKIIDKSRIPEKDDRLLHLWLLKKLSRNVLCHGENTDMTLTSGQSVKVPRPRAKYISNHNGFLDLTRHVCSYSNGEHRSQRSVLKIS